MLGQSFMVFTFYLFSIECILTHDILYSIFYGKKCALNSRGNAFLQDKVSVSKLMEKAAELTTSAMLDVPSIFNGQTFDTIT